MTLAIRTGDAAFHVARRVADGGEPFDAAEAKFDVDLGIGSYFDWPYVNGPIVEVVRRGHFAAVPTLWRTHGQRRGTP